MDLFQQTGVNSLEPLEVYSGKIYLGPLIQRNPSFLKNLWKCGGRGQS